MTVIQVRDLVKRYRAAAGNAVDGVSFDVQQAQLFCLIGPNGAGKTTTVSVLTTTLRPTSGTVLIGGHDLSTEPTAIRRDLGIVFQQQSLDLRLTAEENIRLHAVLYGLYPWRPLYRLMPAAYRRQVQDLAAVLGVSGVLGQPAGHLSGGTRRKLEIVRALMHRPRVLFLDEPTAGLDPQSRRSLWSYLREARRELGTTVFLTTHFLAEAETADAICVLAHGRVIESGSPAQLKARYARPELVLDSGDRELLRRELITAGLVPAGQGPLRVSLAGTSPQRVLAGVTARLTQLRIAEPSLEDAYLLLLGRAG
ncbi:MAG TPA: ABC transporter ATP-binding protein [Streptosporangiaceae bacterium]